jgi:HSP20 family protein
MSEIDEAIDRVENLYRAVTGGPSPVAAEAPYAPIPAERDPVQHVQEQMDRLFQALGGAPAALTAPAFLPPIAVWESQSEVIVYIDVPGVERDRIEVAVQNNVLTIAGHRPPPVANGHRLRFGERPIGAFRRVVPLPLGLKTAELTARLRDGVLEVVLPREVGAGVTNPRPVPIA